MTGGRIGAAPEPTFGLGALVVTPKKFRLRVYLSVGTSRWLGTAIGLGPVTSLFTNGYWLRGSSMRLTSLSFRGPDFDPVAYAG